MPLILVLGLVFVLVLVAVAILILGLVLLGVLVVILVLVLVMIGDVIDNVRNDPVMFLMSAEARARSHSNLCCSLIMFTTTRPALFAQSCSSSGAGNEMNSMLFGWKLLLLLLLASP